MLYSKTTLSLLSSLIISCLILLIPLPVNAEATHELYGTLSYGLQRERSERPNLHYTPKDPYSLPSDAYHPSKEKSRLTPNNKIGIKGEKPIGNGNSIIYQFEWRDEK